MFRSKKSITKLFLLAKNPYHVLNACFIAIILCLFIYSEIFSAEKENHPVTCAFQLQTGLDCPTCGLSRAFSEIIRGKFESAKEYNPYALNLFLFFLTQFILRICASIFIIYYPTRLRIIAVSDSIISCLLFLAAYFPLITKCINLLTHEGSVP
jgi:hypothetical protein